MFPSTELYGLTSQMKRAAVSIPSNIAEGYRRNHNKEYTQFLSISFGSGAELETQMEICKRIPEFQKIDFSRCEKLLDEIMRMLNTMLIKARTRP